MAILRLKKKSVDYFLMLLFFVLQAKPLNVEYVTMDASLLLPPTATPLTGIDFIKRLPCGDTERTQRVSAEKLSSRIISF